MSKPMSPLLSAMLASDRDMFIADAYQFTLVNGGVLRYTNADQDITVNGSVYSAGVASIGPFVDIAGNRSRTSQQLGAGSGQLQFEIIPGEALVNGQPLLAAVQQGAFDGALIKKMRLFMPTFGDTRRGPIVMFSGRVAEAVAGRSKAVFNCSDWRELLDQQFPRNLFQAGCVNNLGDTPCGVNLAALAVGCTVASGTTLTDILANLTVSPTGNFNQGKVTFTSGPLDGLSRTVKLATAGTPGTINLLMPLPSLPDAGDTFDIYPGCDKTYAGTNGCAKFANQARWRGADLTPSVEVSV